MRILANVNVPRVTVEALQLAGLDVVWALERMATDAVFAILAAAQQDSRIVLTNVKILASWPFAPAYRPAAA